MEIITMIIYKFEPKAEAVVPSTPTIVGFVKAMLHMNREGITTFSAVQMIQYAVENGHWTTKQIPERWKTTWDYYLEDLEMLGVTKVGSSTRKTTFSMADLMKAVVLRLPPAVSDE